MAAAAAVGTSRRLLREAVGCWKRGSQWVAYPGCWNCPQGAKRYLLPENILQLQKFQERKLQMGYKKYGEKDVFFKMMEEKLKNNKIILKDELKALLHMCESKNDVELAKRLIYRYHEENKNLVFWEYKFGPIFMRLCYELDLEESAFELIKDQALRGFFSDSTSFNILMDMLFIKGHYQSALEVLLEMKQQDVKFNYETYLLACAICYKLNTPESCRICATLLEDKALKGLPVPRKSYCFAVALFLKQKDVAKARSYYSQIMNTTSQLCHNLGILLQAASGDLNNLVKTLEKGLDCNTPYFVKKVTYSMEVLQIVIKKLDNHPDLWNRFESVFARLQKLGHVTSQTLDDLLCQTPALRKQDCGLLRPRQMNHRTQQCLGLRLLTE